MTFEGLPADVVHKHIIPALDTVPDLWSACRVSRVFGRRIRPALQVLGYFNYLLDKKPTIPASLWESSFDDLARFKIEPVTDLKTAPIRKLEEIARCAGLVRRETKVRLLPLAFEVAKKYFADENSPVCSTLLIPLAEANYVPAIDLATEYLCKKDAGGKTFPIAETLFRERHATDSALATVHEALRKHSAESLGLYLAMARYAPAFEEATAFARKCWVENISSSFAVRLFRELCQASYRPACETVFELVKADFSPKLYEVLLGVHFEPALQEATRLATASCTHDADKSLLLFKSLLTAKYAPAYPYARYAFWQNPQIMWLEIMHMLVEVDPKATIEAIVEHLANHPRYQLLMFLSPEEYPDLFAKGLEAALHEEDERRAINIFYNLTTFPPALQAATDIGMRHIKEPSGFVLIETLIKHNCDVAIDAAVTYIRQNRSSAIAINLLRILIEANYEPIFAEALEDHPLGSISIISSLVLKQYAPAIEAYPHLAERQYFWFDLEQLVDKKCAAIYEFATQTAAAAKEVDDEDKTLTLFTELVKADYQPALEPARKAYSNHSLYNAYQARKLLHALLLHSEKS